MTKALEPQHPSRARWFGRVPKPSSEDAGRRADLDMIDFHRWAAGESECIPLSSVGTLTRINRERERRT